MKFIVEHSVSPRLTEAIAILAAVDGDEVVHLRTHYHQDTLDPIWLKGLGEREPNSIVISADPRITRSPQNRQAWLTSGLTIFFLKSFAGQSPWGQAARLVKWWPEIRTEAGRSHRGDGFLVSVNGRIEKLRR